MAEINDKLKKLLQEVGEIVDVKDRNSAVWSLPQKSKCYDCKAQSIRKDILSLGYVV